MTNVDIGEGYPEKQHIPIRRMCPQEFFANLCPCSQTAFINDPNLPCSLLKNWNLLADNPHGTLWRGLHLSLPFLIFFGEGCSLDKWHCKTVKILGLCAIYIFWGTHFNKIIQKIQMYTSNSHCQVDYVNLLEATISIKAFFFSSSHHPLVQNLGMFSKWYNSVQRTLMKLVCKHFLNVYQF